MAQVIGDVIAVSFLLPGAVVAEQRFFGRPSARRLADRRAARGTLPSRFRCQASVGGRLLARGRDELYLTVSPERLGLYRPSDLDDASVLLPQVLSAHDGFVAGSVRGVDADGQTVVVTVRVPFLEQVLAALRRDGWDVRTARHRPPVAG